VTSPVTAGFRYEADMLAPLLERADEFLPGGVALFEVPCTAGIPDLVLIDIDQRAIGERGDAAPLTQSIDVNVMLALQATIHGHTAAELAAACHVTAAHLRRLVLPRLIEGGHIDLDADHYRPRYAFRSLARTLVTIETKLRDWRGGLGQASRHATVADQAWLVLDARSTAAVRRVEWFRSYGVALGLLSFEGQLARVVEPGVNRSRQPDRELLAERAVALYGSGVSCGPLPRVFGGFPSATGPDPRLPGVEARSLQPAAVAKPRAARA
jgi:hypothetical protein